MMGLVLAGGLLAWTPGESRAQFSLTIGNPYYGSGIAVGNPGFGYFGGYNNFVSPVYPGFVGGYNNFSTTGYVAGPDVFSYSSGYRGFAPAAIGPVYRAPVAPFGYWNRPFYGNPGFRRFGNVPYYGFRPFRGANSWLWR
jgi:hypothetical protein